MLEVKKLKVSDLRTELQRRGLSVSGLKAELIERLEQHLQQHPNGTVHAIAVVARHT